MAKFEGGILERASGDSWLADPRSPENLIRGGIKLDPNAFLGENDTNVTLTANAPQGGVTLSVEPLTAEIPSGTALRFSASTYAYTTAVASKGATSISVEPLPTALGSGASAVYRSTTGLRGISSGTVVGRTYAERDAGAMFGAADDADDEVYLLAFSIEDVTRNNDGVALRPNTQVFENRLPNFNNLSTVVKDKVRSLYRCTLIGK
jgi:hypothetical protein